MKRKISVCVLAILGISAAALATPPFRVIFNNILSMGTANGNLREHVEIPGGGDGDDEDEGWELDLRTHGASDFYMQDYAVAPGGYTGWHSHPGIFVGTVLSGSIDFYDAHCHKRTFTAGQVWTENTEVHAVINTGTVDAHAQFVYLIKRGMPRRIDQPAPSCAPSTGIP